MTYTYVFDDTTVGNWRCRREDYKAIQVGLKSLLKAVLSWNKKALEKGALREPYEQEEQDILDMISFGEEQFADENRSYVKVLGISVGSLRYLKAGLLLEIKYEEDAINMRREQGWPKGVISSLKEKVDVSKKLSEKIEQEPADILWEIIPRKTIHENKKTVIERTKSMEWDVFICHASEDKEGFVHPLALQMRKNGLNVWYDNFELTVGDSLRRSIDRGLAHSQYGIVVISTSFLQKEWPQKELDGLVAREVNGRKVILPVWHNVDKNTVARYSPTLADRYATSSGDGLEKVVKDLLKAIGKNATSVTKVAEQPIEVMADKQFKKVMATMPDLIKEMKEDLTKAGNKFTREFVLASKKWAMSVPNCFAYYFEEHEELQGKVHVLENYGYVIDVTATNLKRYRMTEKFV